jgi:hypothetical protein
MKSLEKNEHVGVIFVMSGKKDTKDIFTFGASTFGWILYPENLDTKRGDDFLDALWKYGFDWGLAAHA